MICATKQIGLSLALFFCSTSLVLAETWQATPPVQPPTTVTYVDVDRYMGVWYEIASYPQPFTQDCVNSQATYKLKTDKTVDVLNECRKGRADGPLAQIRGTAKIVDLATNAKLKVSFGPGMEGDYWIIDLDQNYELTAVSGPTRSTLWILARDRNVDKTQLDLLLKRLHDVHGFDLTKLKFNKP